MPLPCPSCGSALAQPGRWSGGTVRMRCPECESCFAAATTPAGLRELEQAQAAARAALVAAHEDLVAESMEALAATFAAALERDLLGADDFA